MKKFITHIFIGAALLSSINLSAQTYKVDASNSSVSWKGEKIGGSHEGTVNVSSGTLIMKDGMLSSGNFEIDMTSIANTDLQDAEYKAKLEGHLKSPDFFAVEDFPKAMLTTTKVVHQGGNNYKVVGKLTIKGIEKEIKFNAVVAGEGEQVVASADLVIDRSEYNVKYGSGSFFEGLGDNLIYDDFKLSIALTAKQ